MSYLKATKILPAELVEEIQKYVDGATLYIPRAAENQRDWGAATSIREELARRNGDIYRDHLGGCAPEDLAQKYFLSLKSIQRILGQQKRMSRNGLM